jgi:glyoxylase-like metal-dependent hydrolase (beta-lactamase superfamily II)
MDIIVHNLFQFMTISMIFSTIGFRLSYWYYPMLHSAMAMKPYAPHMHRQTGYLSMSSSSKTRLSPQSKIFKYSKAFADVFIVPMFTDNYGYIIRDKQSSKLMTVDPADVSAIAQALVEINEVEKIDSSTSLPLDYIFCTHKHNDHIGGNLALKELFPKLKVIGTKLATILICLLLSYANGYRHVDMNQYPAWMKESVKSPVCRSVAR